jgi:MarR family transcriptional regulator, lower aerobic nicotinate degradation pathway regulator
MDQKNDQRIDLDDQPGHYIRRLQQIAVAIFLQETQAHGITPVQYAALQTVANSPLIDQRTLARSIGLDTSTIAGVVERLEGRGLLLRKPSPQDKRVRQLSLTKAAHQLLAQALPSILHAQKLMLDPLSAADRKEFTRLLQTLVTKNNSLSRAPTNADD